MAEQEFLYKDLTYAIIGAAADQPKEDCSLRFYFNEVTDVTLWREE